MGTFGRQQHPGPLEPDVLQIRQPPLLASCPPMLALHHLVLGQHLGVEGARVFSFLHFALHIVHVPVPQQAGRDALYRLPFMMLH